MPASMQLIYGARLWEYPVIKIRNLGNAIVIPECIYYMIEYFETYK